MAHLPQKQIWSARDARPQTLKPLTCLRAGATLNIPFRQQIRKQSRSQAPQEESMADHERRITPRKSYAIPVRFNVITEQYAMAGVATARQSAKILTTIPLPKQGEIVNLSERGIGFRTRQNLNVGENVEIFFTLPAALTGRAPEDVGCNARVVRVDKNGDTRGMIGIGAAIDRFERTSVPRNWDN
jgi:PilZ domain